MLEQVVEPGFRGHVGLTAAESVPDHPYPATPPSGAPNVVVVVLDDVGFAQVGCYGSDIATPAIDSVARAGLQFTNFHVTPLCSPTRACVLTGRNHHTVGMSTITAFPGGYPHSREAVTRRAGMLSEILGANGYGSYAVGKWHLSPQTSATPAGRFDQWPLARGFDRYYGFLGGETDQYRPNLVQGNEYVIPPETEGYHLSEDLVRVAEQYIVDHRTAAPTRPFFLYLAFGACHSPHQAPPEYIEPYRGRYDIGWDQVREQWYQRQLDLGIIPGETRLSNGDPAVPRWEDMSDDQRRYAARLQEAFAGALEHTDAQIARLLDVLRRVDAWDNTIVMILSDNGAAAEGGIYGSWNGLAELNGAARTVDEGLDHLEALGDPTTYPIYGRGWAQAGNTPCRWYKKNTYAGGIRTPLVVQWPGGGIEPATVSDFQHAIDIVPTVLRACSIDAPRTLGGLEQLPIAGRAMGSVIGDTSEKPPRTQYFEMLGHRGLYHDGYKAVTFHTPGADYSAEEWELFDLTSDFSEADNLASDRPDLLRDLVDRWWVEAGRHGVLPLDDTFLQRSQSRTGTDFEGLDRYVLYRGATRVTEGAGPDLRQPHVALCVDLEAFDSSQEGVLFSFGGRFAGWVWYVRDGQQHLEYNAFGTVTSLTDPVKLPSGDVSLTLRVLKGPGRASAIVEMTGADEAVHRFDVEQTVPYFSGGYGIEVGGNWLSPVTSSYEQPFAFTGNFDHVVVQTSRGDS